MSESKQAGFSLLGVLIAVMIIGIMATMAVPRFTSAIATANTAKVQSDLTTLDAAIAMYQLEKGKAPSTLSDLGEYVEDLDKLKPPKGKCRLKNGEIITLSSETYDLLPGAADSLQGTRAVCGKYKAGDFGNGN